MEIVPHENQHRRQHDRFRGRSAESFGAVPGEKTLVTTDPTHDQAETDRFENAAVDVFPLHSRRDRVPIRAPIAPQEVDADEIAALNPYGSATGDEQRHA